MSADTFVSFPASVGNVDQVIGMTAVSKLWPIIGRIFAIDRGVPHFNAFAGDDSLEYPDKLFLSKN